MVENTTIHLDRHYETRFAGPTAPVERALQYTAPFTLQNRETDYATVWAKLEH